MCFLFTLAFHFRGLFARPASETFSSSWYSSRILLQPQPSVWAGLRRRLQTLSFHAAAVQSSVVHGKVQRPPGVHDSALPLGRWHPLWWRTGLRPRGLLCQTHQTCKGKTMTLGIISSRKDVFNWFVLAFGFAGGWSLGEVGSVWLLFADMWRRRPTF